MKIQMRDIEKHDELIGGEHYTITIGQVENGGWWWECPGFENSEGTRNSREAALKDAMIEIEGRIRRN